MKRFLIVLLLAGCATTPVVPIEQKLDAGLDDARKSYPIFVRMTDQLFAKGGDYEAFCTAHSRDRRRELRATVLRTLRAKSDRSWEAIKSLVTFPVERFWIVNGFAGEANLETCRKLASHPAVSFVYLMRGPGDFNQHDRVPAKKLTDEQRRRTEEVLALVETPEPPFDPGTNEIPWNLEQLGAPAAWRDEHVAGEGVVVAITDSGLLRAPPLLRALWKNPGETLNDLDDDGNGFIDDLFGADFKTQSGWCLDDAKVPHGSACAGIIAGRPTADKPIITGVAPRARIMMLRGMGYLKALEYAADKGADVLSMSYMWVEIELGNCRGVYRAAHEHLAAAGIVALGGAGNFAQTAPAGKQITLPKDIPCVLAVAGVAKNGTQPAFSSRGPCSWKGVVFYDEPGDLIKPDLCTFNTGFPCWSSPTFAKTRKLAEVWKSGDEIYGLYNGQQGNSFAGPHVAGVVALMLSANPDLNVWEVKEILESTCRDLGEPGRDVAYGAGLVQALEAVRAAKARRR